MPVTPFHMIAGVVIKSIKPMYFSWTVFALANIFIDTEAVYYYLTTGVPAHKYFHTWIGASIIAILCATFGKYICELGLKILNFIFLNENYSLKLRRFQFKTKINNFSSWNGAFIGAYSHIFFDSFVNLDMQPYFPFSTKNHLLGLISLNNIYLLCIALFIIGIVIWVKKS